MLTLYEFPRSGNCYKVRLLFGHVGVAYRRIGIDLLKGESRTPAFLALNPAGKVPMVETEDGRRYTESGAILARFARGSRLAPQGLEEEMQILQWLLYEQSAVSVPLGRPRFWLSVLGKADGHDAEIRALHELGHQALARLEAHLSNDPFLVGRRFTIADIALYAYTHVAPEGGYDLSAYPALRGWLARVRAEPGHVAITDN